MLFRIFSTKELRAIPSHVAKRHLGGKRRIVGSSFSIDWAAVSRMRKSNSSTSLQASTNSQAPRPLSTKPTASSSLAEQLAVDLTAILGPGKVSRNETEIINHGSIEDGYVGWNPPDILVYAESSEDVQNAVRLCNEREVPVIPYGAGTSVEGHLDCPRGGIMIDLSRMNKIIAVNEQDMDCHIQAGVTREQLNAYLKGSGLFFR